MLQVLAIDCALRATLAGVLCEVSRALRSLCCSQLVCDRVVAFGGVELFVSLALSTNVDTQTYTAQALLVISREQQHRGAVLADGGCQLLMYSTA